MNHRLNLLFVAMAFALPVTLAQAHGDAKHKPAAVDYSKAEETAFGRAADPKAAKRTVKLDMNDQMRFTPAEVRVKKGEVVRFVVANKGAVLHEMVLGTMDDLKKHAELMKRFPGMEHDEPNQAHVNPGKTGQIGWRFMKAGTYWFGCLIPGHFEAGMIGKVIVD
ncbi:MAG: cupredoxin family protein [Proteobacteria bacterium]|nr:cupredoxin family protein [Pseudomonadota bacterium]